MTHFFSSFFTFSSSLGFARGWMPSSCARGDSAKSVCSTQAAVAVGNASVSGSASSAKPSSDSKEPPKRKRSAKASRERSK